MSEPFVTDDGDEPRAVNAVLGGLYPDNTTCWRVITHFDDDTGCTEYALCFVYETAYYAEYFTSGWFDAIEQATAFFAELLKDDPMNIFKNDRLFPRIKGVMLKDKPVVLTLSGELNVVETKGGDARAELFFTDHKKSATVNRTQLEIIAGLYGAETEQWRGKRIELYGEFGTWFGKETWGIRVSNKSPPAPRNGRKVADADHEGVTDATPKQPGPIATEPTDYQD